MKLGSNLDFAQFQALNFSLQTLSAAPSSGKAGQAYYSTTINCAVFFNGTAWRPADAALLNDGSIPNAALAPIANGLLVTNPLLRSNHGGTQLASTISNLQATVTGYTLDMFAAPAAVVSWGNQRLTGLATATAPTDAVGLGQVNSLIAAAIAGQTAIKVPARVCATGHLSLSGLSTVDGVSLNAGDRVLAPNQSTASQNGLYIAATGTWSLAPDGNVASEWTEGTDILIAEGTTFGGSIFRQATASPTITTLTFVQTAKLVTYQGDGSTIAVNGTTISAILGNGLKSSGSAIVVDPAVVTRKFVGTITGDGTTTSFQFTHGLGTAACHVTIRDSSGNQVLVDNTVTSTTATVAFSAAPASNVSYTVVVTG